MNYMAFVSCLLNLFIFLDSLLTGGSLVVTMLALSGACAWYAVVLRTEDMLALKKACNVTDKDLGI